ncbi:hypothetical protein EBS67_12200 [bacterium]|nr:hypothetical protein [bacterium]NBT62746.1 hypothetical protein [Planctomycetia bacterium]
MAAPNIVSVATMYGKTVGLAVPITATAIASNAAASGKSLKINSLIIANVDGTTAYNITADLYKNGTTSYRIAYLISVPANATLVLLSRESAIYLEEGDSIRLTASTVSKLEAVCSYEEIAV